jgi:hypothetical protein
VRSKSRDDLGKANCSKFLSFSKLGLGFPLFAQFCFNELITKEKIKKSTCVKYILQGPTSSGVPKQNEGSRLRHLINTLTQPYDQGWRQSLLYARPRVQQIVLLGADTKKQKKQKNHQLFFLPLIFYFLFSL